MRLLFLSLLLGGCSLRDPDAVLAEDGSSARGEVIFQTRCAGCHGTEGQGSRRAPALSGTMTRWWDRDLAHTILNGRGRMSGQGLSDQEAADVIAWLSDTWGPIKLVARPDGTPARVAPAAAEAPAAPPEAPAAESSEPVPSEAPAPESPQAAPAEKTAPATVPEAE